jgi:EpsI family protein
LSALEIRSMSSEEPIAGTQMVEAGPPTTRRDLLIGGLLLATAAATFVGRPRKPVIAVSGSIQDILPLRFGGWTGKHDEGFVQPPADELKAAAVYDEQVALSYSNAEGGQVMLLIAYARYQSGLLMVHRPEACYPGAGFIITGDHPADIALAPGKTIAGRFLSTQLLPRIEQVLYWTRLGEDFAASWDDERWMLAMQNLRGLMPDGALIRLSVVEGDEVKARGLLEKFAAQLFGACGAEARALLVGPVNPA